MTQQELPKQSYEIFKVGTPFSDPVRKALFALMKRPLALLLSLKRCNKIYDDYKAENRIHPERKFEEVVLEVAGIDLNVDEETLKRIPKTGPLVLVSNHPFGVVDGLALMDIMGRVRDDYLSMSNHMMSVIPEFAEKMIEVDVFGGEEAARKNIAGMKKALRWLKDGHALMVFPAGEVASLRVKKRMVRDNAWSPTVAGLIRKSKAQVVPVCVKGKHGPLFHALGFIHPRLRTAMIPRANLKQTRKAITAYVGNPIPFEKLERYKTNEELINYLRFRSYLLCAREEAKSRRKAVVAAKEMEPIAPPVDKAQLEAELEALTPGHILVESNTFVVFEAGATRIPGMLQEIGRLREETFRPVGEGTGHALDLDRFDQTYRHLILYNREENEVAGAYRFARCDEIMARQGVQGLYSYSFFRYGPELMDKINPALEFGRSFIQPKYQRTYQALLLLWRAVGEYISRNPEYKTMFGCVSVSSDYKTASREVMIRFLERHRSSPELSDMVRPKRPPKIRLLNRVDVSLPESAFDDPDNIGPYVDDIEVGRGIPVLLRQYMKLGGKIVAFNIDPEFGDCMDGLIVVDITKTPRKMMDRFLGADRAEAYLAYHQDKDSREQE